MPEPSEPASGRHEGHQGHEHSHPAPKANALVGVVASFVLAAISMAVPMVMEPTILSACASGVASFLIIAIWGRKFLIAIPKLFRAADMNTLIGIGVVASFVLSIRNILNGDYMHLYFEAAGFISAFVLLGQYIEGLIQKKMMERMGELAELLPHKAHRLSEGAESDISIHDLRVGDRIRVRVGERVPADCKILTTIGATFDESILTGESKPVSRSQNEKAVQGALNVGQPIELEVLNLSGESLYAKLVHQVRESLKARPEIQKTVDRIATFFVPLVIVISIASAIVWTKFSPESGIAFTTALAVLVIACPCALGLATPTALLVGVLRSAKKGILLKKLDAVDRIGDISLVAFDKTGTLTEGRPSVSRVKAIENISNAEVMQWALSVESTSEHPCATAIRNYCAQEKISVLKAQDLTITPGRGVSGTVQKEGKTYKVVLGSLVWLFENDFDPTQVPKDLTWEAEGSNDTVIWVGVDQKPVGIIMLTDKVREGARELVSELTEDGFEVGMISGDSENVAREVAKSLKLKFFHFGLSPQEKSFLVKRLMEPKRKMGEFEIKRVAFVGDGVNDGPALAQAHLGIAMGSGAALAQSTADVILLSNDLRQIRASFSILRETRSLITQNLILSFGYNVVAIPIAAGALYLNFGILLNPMIASVAMALSSITVLLNSLRAVSK